jgi:hypothetical protein
MQDDLWEQAVATNVRRVLTPVHPSDTFRQRLRSNLELAGQQQMARRAMLLQQPVHVNYWVLGAAALGVTVAAGSMIAWAVRTRFSPTRL